MALRDESTRRLEEPIEGLVPNRHDEDMLHLGPAVRLREIRIEGLASNRRVGGHERVMEPPAVERGPSVRLGIK